MANTIFRGPAEKPGIPFHLEKTASEAMKPGHAVSVNGDDFDLNDSDGADSILLFLKEKSQGLSTGGVEEEFAAGDSVAAYRARQGDFYQARFATAVALVAEETLLSVDTDGQLRIGVVGTDSLVAVAKETVTTSAADQLVTVEVL